MTVYGVTMVKNEADVIAHTVRHMLHHVDHVIVADNMSTDGTRDILAGFGDEITLLDDLEVAYYQGIKMTALAHRAREMGATWVVPFDADEVWFSPFYPTLRAHLEDVHPRHMAVTGDWFHHGVTAMDDPDEANPFLRMRWKRKLPAEMCKVAVRAVPELLIEQGNHHAQFGGEYTRSPLSLEVRHFPYRNVEQFIAKMTNGAKAYAAAPDLAANIGSHWRQAGEAIMATGREAGVAAFEANVVGDDIDEFVEDPAPLWQP